jgi:hypothetical protein
MPAFGPSPGGLHIGDPYIELGYPSIHGKRWVVFLASPAAFERVHGKRPHACGSDCVIDVQEYPQHAVF